jgi:hypothetical protein
LFYARVGFGLAFDSFALLSFNYFLVDISYVTHAGLPARYCFITITQTSGSRHLLRRSRTQPGDPMPAVRKFILALSNVLLFSALGTPLALAQGGGPIGDTTPRPRTIHLFDGRVVDASAQESTRVTATAAPN